MVRKSTVVIGAVGGLLATVGAWNLYQRYSTETVSYTTVANIGDVELRRYPGVVMAETVAPTQREAFGHLFAYIDGANESDESISMTAPVELDSEGTSIPMTAPAAYDLEAAPTPTDDAVELVFVPERTLAVRRFSWRPTDERIEREMETLTTTLEDADVSIQGDPFFMGYDAPFTLPFLRRNEVAVEVR